VGQVESQVDRGRGGVGDSTGTDHGGLVVCVGPYPVIAECSTSHASQENKRSMDRDLFFHRSLQSRDWTTIVVSIKNELGVEFGAGLVKKR
jgi:hypothetical protein